MEILRSRIQTHKDLRGKIPIIEKIMEKDRSYSHLRGELMYYTLRRIDVLQDRSDSLFSQWLARYKVEDNRSSFFLSQLRLKATSLEAVGFLRTNSPLGFPFPIDEWLSIYRLLLLRLVDSA